MLSATVLGVAQKMRSGFRREENTNAPCTIADHCEDRDTCAMFLRIHPSPRALLYSSLPSEPSSSSSVSSTAL